MVDADTSLDDALARLAAFRSFAEGRGVVAQLVEHHNGIRLTDVPSQESHSESDKDSMPCSLLCPECCPPKATVTLEVAIEKLLAAKEQSKRRPAYIRSLRQYLRQFSRGRESQPLSSFSPDLIEEWFSSRQESASAQRSNLGRLGSLFSLGVRRGWIRENPINRIEKATIDQAPPRILTASQCERLMAYVRDRETEAMAWFVLCLFAGVRPHEADRLTWESVKCGTVVVDAAASKVRRRRVVNLMPTAGAWLTHAEKAGSRMPLPYSTRRRAVRRARGHLGLPAWPQDVLRHTCASYWVAEVRDVGRVALELGNSPSILLRHYRELVTREESDRFWKIEP